MELGKVNFVRRVFPTRCSRLAPVRYVPLSEIQSSFCRYCRCAMPVPSISVLYASETPSRSESSAIDLRSSICNVARPFRCTTSTWFLPRKNEQAVPRSSALPKRFTPQPKGRAACRSPRMKLRPPSNGCWTKWSNVQLGGSVYISHLQVLQARE